MSIREAWNFLAIVAFVVSAVCYFGVLAGMYYLVGAGPTPNPDPRSWAAGGAIALVVMVLARFAAKASPKLVNAESDMRAWARRFGANDTSEAPVDALAFERAPLSRLRVASSGPAAVTEFPQRRGVTMVHANLGDSDGPRNLIGPYLAWYDVAGDLPKVSLVSRNFDAELLAAFGSELDGGERFGLTREWRIFGSAKACGGLLTPTMVRFLNSIQSEGLAFQFEPHRVVVWSDRRAVASDIDRLNEVASACASALPASLRTGTTRSQGERESVTEAFGKRGRRSSIGDLKSTSKIRSRLLTAFLVCGLISIPPLIVLAAYLLNGVPLVGGDEGLLATGIVLAVAGVTAGLAWVSNVLMRRLDKRHEAIASEVHAVALTADLVFSPRVTLLEQGWSRRPFSVLKNVGAAPAASAYREWGSFGVAYIEGDIGASVALLTTFQSRVAWAELGGGLPRMDFMREGFASRAATLVGGTDLDTESYAFNTRWRIRTDHPREAHAMLQPLMIEFLTAAAEDGIAIHLDRDRVVIWDDGTDETADLAARLALIERFVAALPAHMRG